MEQSFDIWYTNGEPAIEYVPRNNVSDNRIYLQHSTTGKRFFLTDPLPYPSECKGCGRNVIFDDIPVDPCPLNCHDTALEASRRKCEKCQCWSLSAVDTCGGCEMLPKYRVCIFATKQDRPFMDIQVRSLPEAKRVAVTALESVIAYDHYKFDSPLSSIESEISQSFAAMPFVKDMVSNGKSTAADLIGAIRTMRIVYDDTLINVLFPNFYPKTVTFGLVCSNDSIGPSRSVTMADVLNVDDYVFLSGEAGAIRTDLNERAPPPLRELTSTIWLCTREEIDARAKCVEPKQKPLPLKKVVTTITNKRARVEPQQPFEENACYD